MSPFLLVIIIAVFIFLVVRSLNKKDGDAESCAKEVTQALRQNPETSPEDIAAILRKHNRTSDDAGKVTVLVKSRLSQAHIRKEEQQDVMLRVRKAKEFIN